MADEARLGKHWTDDELDAIVADYFAMLMSELSGVAYVKLGHSKALMAAIGRTHRSVEFKHQNISAVLEELGMPWIAGYKPKRNYQGAIIPAVDRYLSTHPDAVEVVSRPAVTGPMPKDVFVPTPLPREAAAPRSLQRLVGNFDPVERDHRNRLLGRAGELFVIEFERRRLTDANRCDLARKVRWIAQEEGDAPGYDVLSFEPEGQERLLEVKTTNGSPRTPFFLSRNEIETSREHAALWRIYRVHLFATDPRIFVIKPPLERTLRLSPQTWRASF